MANPNWSNQTIFTGDNIDIMRGMNSETVDMIYLDPPFNSKANYAAPVGSQAAGAEFKDTWGLNDINLAWHGLIKSEHPNLYAFLNAVRGIHGDSMMSYLIYMVPRIMEMHRILKSTGSIYLHCDPTASHYLKVIMDRIFGKENFRNHIVWSYRRWAGKSKKYQGMHDDILFCVKSAGDHTWTWPMEEKAGGTPKHKRWNAINPSTGKMKTYSDKSVAVNQTNMRDVWEIPRLQSSSSERTGYPTQKPLALLRRIIEASSNENDIILDPFAGCATTCVAAEQLNRQWAGIDISPKAAELVKDRLMNKIGVSIVGVVNRTDIPKRTDQGKIPKYNSIENKRKLYGEQEGICLMCKYHFPIHGLTIDHLVPRSKGGTDHISNLQLLCQSCNSRKGNLTQEELLARLINKKLLVQGEVRNRKGQL